MGHRRNSSLLAGVLLAACLLAPVAHAQTYSPLPEAKIQFFDANGNPLSGGKVCTFITGTATPLATYTDATGGTPNANPVVLDSAGRANIWLISTSTYRITLQDSTGLSTKCNGVQIWSADGVIGTLGSLTNIFVKNPTSDQDSTGNYRISSAGSLAWKSGTAFFGTLAHANTGNKIYTFPDATFTVPAPSLAQTWTAAHTWTSTALFGSTVTINGTTATANLYPQSSSTFSLGSSSFRWLEGWIDTLSVKSGSVLPSTGGIRLSKDKNIYSAKATGGTNAMLIGMDAGDVVQVGKETSVNLTTIASLSAALPSGTTPAVLGASHYIEANGAPTSITNFTGAVFSGYIIIISCTTANTTLVNGTTIKLAGAVNFTCAANSTITLISDSSTWYELARTSLPAKAAAIDLTAQSAAITTTTLYAVPASGAGQYRISWNAKVTTVASTGAMTSTLGALTIVYTDPDAVVQTITMPASIAAGTIATTSTGNTTATVLLGLPLTLNCKLSTNITYAFAYASNTAAEMQFNLHIVLEKL